MDKISGVGTAAPILTGPPNKPGNLQVQGWFYSSLAKKASTRKKVEQQCKEAFTFGLCMVVAWVY